LGGVFAPAGLGFLVGYFMLPESPLETKLFLAITLCATSAAIKLRVLYELKMLDSTEGRIIIGAAIVDDVITLMLLGMVSGIALTGKVSLVGLGITGGISLLFLFAIGITSLKFNWAFGDFVTRRFPEGLKIALVAVVCLVLAFLSESLGLRTIVGAFGAGLLLQNIKLMDSDGKEHNMEWFVRIAYWILVPILFVRVGAQVEIESFFNMRIVLVGLAIAGAAILGKLFCSVCVAERGMGWWSRLAIGIAMVPRLEVTLIIATIGKSLGVLSDALFSSIVVMVVITALVSPPFLKMTLLKRQSPQTVRGG
jgi:Kef-type K+ transport system membrane component KefB